jgi:hypothetical protein
MTQKEAIEITASYNHYAGKFLMSYRNHHVLPLLHATYKTESGKGRQEYVPVFSVGFTENRDELCLPIPDVIDNVKHKLTHYLVPNASAL